MKVVSHPTMYIHIRLVITGYKLIYMNYDRIELYGTKPLLESHDELFAESGQ
jgi:hypothetical protein